MLNSVVLEVAIGLILVYLLYSLLVTILTEMVVSWIDLRARVLRRAIERMLNDEADTTGLKFWIRLKEGVRSLVLKESPLFENSLAGKFYAIPLIKYLSEGVYSPLAPFKSGKPSYILPSTFAQGMVHLLRQAGGSATGDIDRIVHCLEENTLGIDSATLDHLKNLLIDSGKDLEAFAAKLERWFTVMADRTTGWFKRKQRTISLVLGFVIAAAFNVDTIRIVSLLSKDNDARNRLSSMAVSIGHDSTAVKILAMHNNPDSAAYRGILDSSFALTKADIAAAGSVLGLGWSAEFPEHFQILGMNYYYLRQFNPGRREFWGLILTALALSLGAPFWFDLLQKVVSLRGTGPKPAPEPAPGSEAVTATSGAADVSRPVQFAIGKEIRLTQIPLATMQSSGAPANNSQNSK